MSMHPASGAASSAAGNSIIPPGQHAASSGAKILKARYRIEHRIGVGAVTEVYEAFDLERRRRCAIKMLRTGVDCKLDPKRRFEQEAAIVSRLSHPHIVEVYAFDHSEEGQPFLVMEMLRGRTLQDLLSDVGRLSFEQTLTFLRPIAAALQYVHELGVLHPSIRPGAVFLHRQHDSEGDFSAQARLIDFGLARAPGFLGIPASAQLGQGLIVGTPGYLPPETLQSAGGQLDERADQWSLAVLAYRMVAGRLPFEAPNPYLLCALIRTTPPTPLHRLRPDLPVHVCEAIDRAMSKEPEERFARIGDFMRALKKEGVRSASVLPERLARLEPPPTEKFDSSDLLELCRRTQLQAEAVPEPIDEGGTTSRYSDSAPRHLMEQAPPDVPVVVQSVAEAVPAPRRVVRRGWLWALGLVLFTLLPIALSQLLASPRRPGILETPATESGIPKIPIQPLLPPVIPILKPAPEDSTLKPTPAEPPLPTEPATKGGPSFRPPPPAKKFFERHAVAAEAPTRLPAVPPAKPPALEDVRPSPVTEPEEPLQIKMMD